ncbi:MAG: hypothetical protein IJ344_02505 [Clostridia bacterium]|nr:hypothetical protein [Clostridia bacterium]
MKKQHFETYGYVLRGISLPYTADAGMALQTAKRALSAIGVTPMKLSVFRRSVDARKKKDIRFIYSVYALCDRALSEKQLLKIDAAPISVPAQVPQSGHEELSGRVIVVGFGPCGMFAALTLAKKGYRPLVIERGAPVARRREDVDRFLKTGILNAESNVQFGAGDAGTFSDGKLVTRVNDPLGSVVFETLHSFGAPDSILTLAKPHVGTDKLLEVVARADDAIRAHGGEILYDTKMVGISRDFSGRITSVLTSQGEIPCGALILAIGHSARDTYELLLEKGITLEAKDFSVGARTEHLQEDIDRALYGDADVSILGHGEYSLSYREGERGVYSFCMCPGGEVICASSEQGGLVVNGMSNFARDGRNANAAIAVSVLKSDYGATPRQAIAYQRAIEQRAFVMAGGGYRAPIQTLGDFLGGTRGSEPSRILPSFRSGSAVTLCDLSEILPAQTVAMMRRGFVQFEKRIEGYSCADAVLTGVETRTSAPVRITRTAQMHAPGCENLFPAGEGAGYAGGITSAAIDGMKAAYAVIGRYQAKE